MYAEAMLDYENFNFTVPFPSGESWEYVDMREILHKANDQNQNNPYDCKLIEPQMTCGRLFADMQVVAEMTALAFKSEYLYSHCAYSNNKCNTESDTLIRVGGYATCLLMISLLYQLCSTLHSL